MKEFVDRLVAEGDVRRISRRVDPRHELAAVTQASQRRDDKAILFEDVAGARFPVITNQYGSRRRLCAMIGAEDGNFCRRWTELTAPERFRDAGPAERVADGGEGVIGALSDLPLITYFEKDAGAYFTSGVFLAKEPETGVPNLSFHRAMYVSDTELRIRLGTTHDLARYFAKAEAAGKPLEVAMLVGPPPEVFLGAAASLPYDSSEIDAAALIRGEPIPMRPCRTVDLMVPAETDIVVEGRLLPGERRPEGPFGEFMGFYVPIGDNAVFEVTHVEWREGAYFHSLLCGSPEDMLLLDYAIATRIYRHLINQVPGVLDVACHPSLLNTVVRIDKQYADHGKHVALAAFGAHLDYSKACIVVDRDVDIHDFEEVWWAYLTMGRADKRAFLIEDMPGFYRDPHKDHYGRLGIDATRPWGREAEFDRKVIPGADGLRLEDYADG